MSERADTEFKSHGTRCGAWHYVPEGAGPHPYVVMAHGLGATTELGLDDFARKFAEAGYGVLAFDYRHFGMSDGEPRDVISIRRQLQDWESALAYVRTLPGVDCRRIAIWGSSFGGAHAINHHRVLEHLLDRHDPPFDKRLLVLRFVVRGIF